MKKSYLLCLFTCVFAYLNAQEKDSGMHFEQNTTWQKVLAIAKKENKYIFVDCFTTWCGPCKIMAYNVFPKAEVGDFFNANFLNVKLQMDTVSIKDNQEIKNWYATSHQFREKYEVLSYPTYLIFNSNGELVHRFVGSMPAEEFVSKGKATLNPENQYYTQLRKYKAGDRNPDFLYKLAIATSNAEDKENAKAVANEYLATQTNLFTKDNLAFIEKTTNKSSDKGFEILLNNTKKVDSILGKKDAEQMVKWIIFNEEISPYLPKQNTPTKPDWIAIEDQLAVKYPTMAKKTTLFASWFYYNILHDWKNFSIAVTKTLLYDTSGLSTEQLNQFALQIFQNCNDIDCIKSALDWSKKSFMENNNHEFIDTYANLLFKAGKKQEAISWETKALAIAKEKNDPSVGAYERTLSEMKVKKYVSEDTRQGSPLDEPF